MRSLKYANRVQILICKRTPTKLYAIHNNKV